VCMQVSKIENGRLRIAILKPQNNWLSFSALIFFYHQR